MSSSIHYSSAESFPVNPSRIDIIIPVYRGLEETRLCLNSVLAFPQQTPHEVIVIDDCSPEVELSDWLRGLAGIGAITLLVNPVNVGFVNTVNRGMALHPERDVVLLNSDTEVHGNWLDRLQAHTSTDPMIGTVTPFSNNATICSYPRFLQSNLLPEDWTLAALDKLFAKIHAGQSFDIPTAVGFCMYITRRCLDRVGYFDAALFKRGYGEENDFSMRALDIGFHHLLATDVFIYHRGGVSFGSDSQALSAEAQQLLEQRHPGYPDWVRHFCSHDPGRRARRRIDLYRLIQSKREKILFITHALGGGTEKHVQDLADLLAPNFEVLVLRPTSLEGVSIEWVRRGEEFKVYYKLPYEYEKLLDLIREFNIQYLHIHHFIGLNQILLRLPQDLNIPYDFTVHDYYCICPQYHLVDEKGSYCGEPDPAGCNGCLAKRPAPWGLDILTWRNLFHPLLLNAQRVIAPSRDVLSRMRRYVPEARYVELPHPEFWIKGLDLLMPSSRPRGLLKIVVLGGITPAKGLHLLEACAIDAKQRNLPLFFKVIGYINGPLVRHEPEIPLSFSGRYEDNDLSFQIKIERPDLIFFPAQWPETYSYTLSFAMQTGLPIVAPRIGAFCERLSHYPMVWLSDWNTSAQSYNDLFVSLLGEDFLEQDGDQYKSYLSPDDFLKIYLEKLPNIELKRSYSLSGAFAALENLLTKNNYYLINEERNIDIDLLNRMELIKFVKSLSPDDNKQGMTKEKVLAFIENLKTEMQEKSKIIEQLSTRLIDQNAEINGKDEEIKKLQRMISELYASSSWKITKPLRWLKQKRVLN